MNVEICAKNLEELILNCDPNASRCYRVFTDGIYHTLEEAQETKVSAYWNKSEFEGFFRAEPNGLFFNEVKSQLQVLSEELSPAGSAL